MDKTDISYFDQFCFETDILILRLRLKKVAKKDSGTIDRVLLKHFYSCYVSYRWVQWLMTSPGVR